MEEEAPEVREQPSRESSAAEVSAGQRGLGGGQVWVGVRFGWGSGLVTVWDKSDQWNPICF